MRLILSRKGFDSSSGGCPSPLFPDGQLYSLPIPDPAASARYCDLVPEGIASAGLVSQLTGHRGASRWRAHLDPDLRFSSRSRPPGWLPSLGQAGSAQGHLRNQRVGEGDLFLFFGLFRPVERRRRRWRFVASAPARHILWGWLQVGAVWPVAALSAEQRRRLEGHPHLQQQLAGNTIYAAADTLDLPPSPGVLPGAGVFTHFHELLQLSDPDGGGLRQWRLPAFFYPAAGAPPLSYHTNPEVWCDGQGFCGLRSAARGQEFVLQGDYYPQALVWARGLIERFGRGSLTL